VIGCLPDWKGEAVPLPPDVATPTDTRALEDPVGDPESIVELVPGVGDPDPDDP
jgi:hypothetical protein